MVKIYSAIRRWKQIACFAAIMAIALSFTSCIVDNDYRDDLWTSDNFIGTWKVVEVGGDYYNCPYEEGDRFEFNGDGTLYTYGRGNFSEYGEWYVRNGYLYIDFDGDRFADVRADIPTMDYDYISLRIDDRTYNTYYSLRLIRQGY